jgi:hypothetical protein
MKMTAVERGQYVAWMDERSRRAADGRVLNSVALEEKGGHLKAFKVDAGAACIPCSEVNDEPYSPNNPGGASSGKHAKGRCLIDLQTIAECGGRDEVLRRLSLVR